MSLSPSQKRKRAADDDTGRSTVQLEHANPDAIPILATTPGISLPPSVSFKAYKRPSTTRKSTVLGGDEFLVHGDHPQISYTGEQSGEDHANRHYVGIYDPETGKVEVFAAPKVQIRRAVKAAMARVVPDRKQELSIMDSRAALGEEFGTKKSRKVIREREANKVDVSLMEEGLSTSIVNQVGASTKNMPTREELEKSVIEGRQIPPVNPDATSPTEVYNLADIISPPEMSDINVRAWYDAAANNTPPTFKSSMQHVITRIPLFTAEKSSENTRKLKILKYIAWLIEFYHFVGKNRGFKRDSAKRALHIDGIILDKILERYAKKEPGDKDGEERYTAESRHRNKLLSYMAVLCMMIHDCKNVDLFLLKHDLQLLPSEINSIFKQIGCKLKDVTPAQASLYGYSKAEAKQHKLADLPAQPDFPKPPSRRIK